MAAGWASVKGRKPVGNHVVVVTGHQPHAAGDDRHNHHKHNQGTGSHAADVTVGQLNPV